MNASEKEMPKNGQPIEKDGTPEGIAALTEGLDRDIQLERAKKRLNLHKIIGVLGILDMCILSGGAVIQMQEAMAAETTTKKARNSELKAVRGKKVAITKEIQALKKALKYVTKYGETRQELHDETIKRVSVEMLLQQAEHRLKLAEFKQLRTKKYASDTINLTHHILTFHSSIVDCIKKKDTEAGKCVKTTFYDKFLKKKKKRKLKRPQVEKDRK